MFNDDDDLTIDFWRDGDPAWGLPGADFVLDEYGLDIDGWTWKDNHWVTKVTQRSRHL